MQEVMIVQENNNNGKQLVRMNHAEPDFAQLSESLRYLERAIELTPDGGDPEWQECYDEIIRFQDADGSFKLLDSYAVDADARVDFCHVPTYICTAFLMKAYLTDEALLCGRVDEVLAPALKACCARALCGHGYEGVCSQIRAMRLMIRSGVAAFMDKYPDICPEFSRMICDIVDGYRRCIEDQQLEFGFGENHEGDFREIIAAFSAEDKDLVWYVSYGSNMLKSRFMHYIQGGLCPYNGKSYAPCADRTPPIKAVSITLPYDMYYANYNQGAWKNSAVSFLDTSKPGKAYGRAYLIRRAQLEEIHAKEGRGANWYPNLLQLDDMDGIPAYTYANNNEKPREPLSRVSMEYGYVLFQGIKEAFPTLNDDAIYDYLHQCGEKRVSI